MLILEKLISCMIPGIAVSFQIVSFSHWYTKCKCEKLDKAFKWLFPSAYVFMLIICIFCSLKIMIIAGIIITFIIHIIYSLIAKYTIKSNKSNTKTTNTVGE